MKLIKETISTLGTIYVISLNNQIIKEVNIQLIKKRRHSDEYLLLINSLGKAIHDVFYFINYGCIYETSNTKLQYIQALRLLYAYSEVISKDITVFNQKDFNDLSRFILGQSVEGSQEEWYFETRRSINTHNVYLAAIRKYYRYLNLSDKSIFESLVVDVSKSAFGVLAHTKNRSEIKYKSNISKVKYNKVPKFISKEEYRMIKESFKTKGGLLNLRNEVIIDLMYLKGLRLGEVLGLTLEDIKTHPDDKNAGILLIRNRMSDKSFQYAKNSIHPKSEKDYETIIYEELGVQKIILPEGIKKKIDKYMYESRDLATISDKIINNMLNCSRADAIDSKENNFYLFLSKNGTPLTSSGWNFGLRNTFKKLNIHTDEDSKKTNLSHRFRHGYAMYLINELELSLEEVSRYMRHRSVTSTYIYYNPTELDIMNATKLMEKEMNQKLFGGGGETEGIR